MARSNDKTPAKTKPEAAPDLIKALLDALAGVGIKPKVKWAPSRNYASLYVDGQNIGYVFRQTRKGVRVEPAASLADLPKGVKAGTRSARFALVGVVTDEASVKHAADALQAADEKRKAAKP